MLSENSKAKVNGIYDLVVNVFVFDSLVTSANQVSRLKLFDS